jgi:hypothetical protein
MVPEKVLHHVALHTLGTLRVQTPCDLKGARRGYMRIGESRSILPSMPQVRHLSIAESRKMPIVEINLQAALEGLKVCAAPFGLGWAQVLDVGAHCCIAYMHQHASVSLVFGLCAKHRKLCHSSQSGVRMHPSAVDYGAVHRSLHTLWMRLH